MQELFAIGDRVRVCGGKDMAKVCGKTGTITDILTYHDRPINRITIWFDDYFSGTYDISRGMLEVIN